MRAAANCPEQCGVRFLWIGADPQIIINGIPRRWQYRHDPFLTAFSDNAQNIRQWRIRTFQAQSFGYPQAAAPQQGEHCNVTGRDPRLPRLYPYAIDHRGRGVDGKWTG